MCTWPQLPWDKILGYLQSPNSRKMSMSYLFDRYILRMGKIFGVGPVLFFQTILLLCL